MGNVMGSPIMVKLRTGTDSSTKLPIYKWFVMVANGLNSNQNDGNANANAPRHCSCCRSTSQPAQRGNLARTTTRSLRPCPAQRRLTTRQTACLRR